MKRQQKKKGPRISYYAHFHIFYIISSTILNISPNFFIAS